ncbi:MAG TPA: dienelactone hydrolase family protein [Acidimicrobiales bacterium]|nr:dienelactone hydrolase family protein [Acidimicrobiales bacterium]
MDHFQEYLATEVALDHAQGQLTRREALRRLGMMGLSLTAASALLAACGDDGDDSPTVGAGQATTTAAPATTPTTARPATTPVPTQDVTFPGPNGTLMGAYAAAGSPRGAVVVVHENRGLVDTTKAVAGRLAGDGYSALAVDLLSEEGGTARVPSGEISATLNAAGPGRIRPDIRATIDELVRRNPSAKVGMIGFCFGGTVVWDFLTQEEPRLLAATPFYGTVPADVTFRTRAAVLGVYGETDNRVNATRDAAKAGLERAGIPHEIKTYQGVGHAFYNNVESPQSKQAYSDVLDWYGRYLR